MAFVFSGRPISRGNRRESTAAPAGLRCLNDAAATFPVTELSSLTRAHAVLASRRLPRSIPAGPALRQHREGFPYKSVLSGPVGLPVA